VKKRSSSTAFVSDELGLCPPRSRFLLVAPPLPPFPSSLPPLWNGAVRRSHQGGGVWRLGGLEFGSGLYSPSSSMAGEW
jgi:hypothetical protein